MKISIIGDIICEDVQLLLNSQYKFSNSIKYFLLDNDYNIANLETPIAGEECKYTYEKYSFNTPDILLKLIKEAGIELLLTANNHCLDRSIVGLKKTICALNKHHLEHIGTYYDKDEKHYIIKETDGIKIGIINFTYGTNAFANENYLKKEERFMVDLFQKQELYNPLLRCFYKSKLLLFKIMRKIFKIFHIGQFTKQIYERKESDFCEIKNFKKVMQQCKTGGADVIIVCLHVGGQYNEEPVKYTKDMCELSLKFGADMVFANHEHVIHPINMEYLRQEKLVVYSLGNFISTAGVTSEPFHKLAEYSMGVNICITRDENSKIIKKYSLTIFKTTGNKENLKVNLLYDLYTDSVNETEKTQLWQDNKKLLNKIMGTHEVNYNIQREYSL